MSILTSLTESGWVLDLDEKDRVVLVPPQHRGKPLAPATRVIIVQLQRTGILGALSERDDGRRQAAIDGKTVLP